MCAFDVSTLNENVLFELGYAIARAKPIWLLLDKTDANVQLRWREFQLLAGVGVTDWENAEDIKKAFISRMPHLDPQTLYHDLIQPSLGANVGSSIFHVPPFHNTEAARQTSRRLEIEARKGIRILSADPTESALNALEWYAGKAYESQATIVHFEAARREMARLHNPRSALVAGIAYGLDRSLLMLSENDYSPPLDYEGILRPYKSSRECSLILEKWLYKVNLQPQDPTRLQRVKLATELRSLRFGEHVAENELDTLADYFVETASFGDVISPRNSIFVGRKGTGKTANMYQAAAELSADARNLVVVIKPAAYEFSSLLALLSSLPVSLRQYSIEALWKFLLTSEVANRVVEVVEARPPGIPFTQEEERLLNFEKTMAFGLREDFGVRFERTVMALESLGLTGSVSEAKSRDLLNEALHSQAIARLRSLLGPVLRNRRRVAILIDNLDKGWEKQADLDLLGRLLLGLLSAIGRVAVDFSKEDYWRERISLTLATFLRSDIYAFLQGISARARQDLDLRCCMGRPPGSAASLGGAISGGQATWDGP